MIVLVAGANGDTGSRVVRLLAERGHEARALIRNEAQAPRMEQIGGQPVSGDLERGEVVHLAEGCEAIFFCAGAGEGSGPARKETVDYGGAVKLAEAALEQGVQRYIMLSALGVTDPGSWSEAMKPYYEAKSKADRRLAESGLDYTIVRPGRLTSDPGTGMVDAAPNLGRRGEIPRNDVALSLVECLELPGTVRKSFDLLSGTTPVREALALL